MNKKGFTVVELIVTFVFVMLVTIELMLLVNNYRDTSQKQLTRRNMESYKNEILQVVQNDINRYFVDDISYLVEDADIENDIELCNGADRGIRIKFKEYKKDGKDSKYLCIKNRRNGEFGYISYDGIKYSAPDQYVNYVSDTMINSEEIDGNNIYNILIKINNEDINENFDIHIVTIKTNNTIINESSDEEPEGEIEEETDEELE